MGSIDRIAIADYIGKNTFNTLSGEVKIAWVVGYGDPRSFRKVFHKVMDLAPAEYRRRFAVGNK